MTDRVLTRRTAIRGGVAAGISVAVAGAAASCSTGSSTSNTPADNAGVELPTYVPYTGVKADVPSTAEGAQPAFFSYPAEPTMFTEDAPGAGGTVEVVCSLMSTPPKQKEDNRFWQELNRKLGAELIVNGAPSADYPSKFQTVVAGGDLPDLAQIMANTPDLPNLLRARFQDLSEYLSADNIKKYPALANIPTRSWQSAVYNGGIYGIPIHRSGVRLMTIVRGDLVETAGQTTKVESGQQFIELCRALTDPKSNQWALDEPLSTVSYLGEMLEVPNNWSTENGKFTKDYESPNMKKALEIAAQMWSENLFHPDALSATGKQQVTWLATGRTRVHVGAATWSNIGVAVKEENPEQFMVPIAPPLFDGGGVAKTYLGTGIFSITALKKASKPRIEELLRVLNWLAAPFGTAEHQFRVYGIKDWDYTLKGSDPILTPTGKAETPVPTIYIGACPVVHYSAGYADIAKEQALAEQAALANGVPWPTAGLYSPTDQSKGAGLEKNMTNLMTDIIVGRKPVSAWDDGVRSWKTGGGDAIRAEYEESLQTR